MAPDGLVSSNIPCVGPHQLERRQQFLFAKYPSTSWEVPDDDGMWVGSASTADHVRCVGGGVRAGVDRPGVAAGSGAAPAVVARRRRRPSERWPGVDRGGGLHRLALRRGGGRGRWVRGASRRAGRYAGGPRPQAARQDRPHRLSAVARVVGRRAVAGVVDPADGGVGVARTSPALQDVGRSTLDVGATDPRRALSARGRCRRARSAGRGHARCSTTTSS